MIPKHILECMAILTSAYPNWLVTEETIAVWAQFMEDLRPEDLKAAVLQHVRNSKFAPTIAEVRAIARGPGGISPEEAWLEVHAQVRKHGWNGKPTFSDAKVEAGVKALGGWRSLCSLTTSEMGFARAHFLKFYGSFTARQEDAQERESVRHLMAGYRDGAMSLEEFNRRDARDIDDEERRELEGGAE